MNISFPRNALLKVLSHQQSLIERRTSIPILSHVLLNADEIGIKARGTDLEMTLVQDISGTVTEPGSQAIPVHILYEIVKKLPEESPVIMSSSSSDQVLVRGGGAEFVLPTLNLEEFPKVPTEESSVSFYIGVRDLKDLLENTAFCMSTDEARYSLNGIRFHIGEDKQWRSVATDAHRLAVSSYILPENCPELPDVIVGRKTVQELSKLLDGCSGQVKLSFSDRQISLDFEGGTFTSRLLEGHFPDYWQAIPQGHPYKVDINVSSIQQAVGRVGMVSSDKQRMVKFHFQPQKLTLSAYSQQYGSGSESIPLDYNGEELALGFNPKYFLDICQRIRGDGIRFQFKDGLSPVLFSDLANPQGIYVLMPVRV
jgi:DNA polymerase-3 subunit beta